MYKSRALITQVCSEKDYRLSKKQWFSIALIIWFFVILTGWALGYCVTEAYAKPAKELIYNSGFSAITGPRFYTDSLWLYVWVLKFLSFLHIYTKSTGLEIYKPSIPSDLILTLLFFVMYPITVFIYSESNKTFKISGHGLILTMTSCMVYMEGKLNHILTKSQLIKNISWSIVFLNLYIMFWTSLGYHSLLESLSGSFLGLFTSYLVYNKFNR
jgi:hypothetical protein